MDASHGGMRDSAVSSSTGGRLADAWKRRPPAGRMVAPLTRGAEGSSSADGGDNDDDDTEFLAAIDRQLLPRSNRRSARLAAADGGSRPAGHPGGSGASRFAESFAAPTLLGEGGQGQVWRCRNVVDNAMYAVKQIPFRSDSKSEAHAKAEIRALAQLQHPRVVRYYGAWFEDVAEAPPEEGEAGVKKQSRRCYIQMEYCDERTLRECIKSRVFTSSPEGFRLGLAVLRQLLESVDYIHRQGVVHRDLKPENVFFDSGAHPIADTGSSVGIKVGDFGLASFEREEYAGSPATRFSRPASASECWTLDEPSSQKERLSATCRQPERASCRPSPSDTVVVAAGESQRPPLCSKQATPLKRSRGVGTPLYCAPEQETTTEYSCLVDEYSVGIIAFEMFAGFREIERVRGIRELRRTGRVPDAWLGRKYPALVAIVESLAALSSTERSSASEVLMRWFDSTLTPFHAMSSRVSLDLIQLLYPSSPSASNRAVLPNGSASALSSALTDQQ
eukprot:gene405-579_t